MIVATKPLPTAEAVARIGRLEAAIVGLDRLLRERHDEELDRRRVSLEEEHARLHEAVETLRSLQGLPRCAWRQKVAHARREAAEQHLAMLQVVSDVPHALQLNVYKCFLDARWWHVGHAGR